MAYLCKAFDWQKKPLPIILELLKIAEIKHDGTMENIIRQTQAKWLRKPNVERWEITTQNVSFHTALHQWLKQNNFVQELPPKKEHYMYLIIMGFAAPRAKQCIAYAEKMAKRCKKVLVLCGERPLDQKIESFGVYAVVEDKDHGLHEPKTETEMMQYIINHSSLRNTEIEWYSIPMLDAGDGKKRRPTTADTIIAWQANHPQPDSCLIASVQPRAHHQDAIVRQYIPPSFTVETCAPAIEGSISDGEHLDNLARWLYQDATNCLLEIQRHSKK